MKNKTKNLTLSEIAAHQSQDKYTQTQSIWLIFKHKGKMLIFQEGVRHFITLFENNSVRVEEEAKITTESLMSKDWEIYYDNFNPQTEGYKGIKDTEARRSPARAQQQQARQRNERRFEEEQRLSREESNREAAKRRDDALMSMLTSTIY